MFDCSFRKPPDLIPKRRKKADGRVLSGVGGVAGGTGVAQFRADEIAVLRSMCCTHSVGSKRGWMSSLGGGFR
jgi:hypothetical protein